jgi:hypothetical protein
MISFADKPESKTVLPKITVYVWSEDSGTFKKWQGEPYGLLNPLSTDANGGYRLLLPSGKYYMKIQTTGYEKLRSTEFDVAVPQYITFNFKLVKRTGVSGYFRDLLDNLTIYE